jgi:hypothetical protein
MYRRAAAIKPGYKERTPIRWRDSAIAIRPLRPFSVSERIQGGDE